MKRVLKKLIISLLSGIASLSAYGWTRINPANPLAPHFRYGHGSCYLPAQNALFIFGGVYMQDPIYISLGDAWLFYLDSLVWREIDSSGPSPRNFPAVCYLDSLDRVFVFGGLEGCNSGSPYNDTWLWDPQTMAWESLQVDRKPRPRNSPACAYDPIRNRVLIFGGWSPPQGRSEPFLECPRNFYASAHAQVPFDTSEFLEDLWVFYPDSNKWDSIPKTGPWPHRRATGSFVYDPYAGRLLLFGGCYLDWGGDIRGLRDAWALDLATLAWDSLETAGFVPERFDHSAVFDLPRNRMMVYGGLEPRDTVYALDMGNLSWYRLNTPPPTPGEYRIAPLVPDTGFIRAYLFSGFNSNDLWALDLSTPGVSEKYGEPAGLLLLVSPNPAKGPVKISFSVPDGVPYSLKLYDPAGRMVGVIQEGPGREGPGLTGEILWEPYLRPGVYFLRLEAGGRSLTEKMVVR
ncbi:MAG: kelch repeat-containing protein [candidate division WOR-3 bacterium]